jgi:hypothetical protein
MIFTPSLGLYIIRTLANQPSFQDAVEVLPQWFFSLFVFHWYSPIKR